ncbi:unnamed protein product [Orchesella dallaii]|uniref:Uncharacterized protein n=1 Tax=Orchesella dallaii TaxID=48710 RepID=A0ABP1QJN0_9HEXA
MHTLHTCFPSPIPFAFIIFAINNQHQQLVRIYSSVKIIIRNNFFKFFAEPKQNVMEKQMEERSSGAVANELAQGAVSAASTSVFQQEASTEASAVVPRNDKNMMQDGDASDREIESLRLVKEKVERIKNGIIAKIWRNIACIRDPHAAQNDLNSVSSSPESEGVVETDDDSDENEEETEERCQDNVVDVDENETELKSQNDASLSQPSPILIDLTVSDLNDGVTSMEAESQNIEGDLGENYVALDDVPEAVEEVIVTTSEAPVSPVAGPSSQIPQQVASALTCEKIKTKVIHLGVPVIRLKPCPRKAEQNDIERSPTSPTN